MEYVWSIFLVTTCKILFLERKKKVTIRQAHANLFKKTYPKIN